MLLRNVRQAHSGTAVLNDLLPIDIQPRPSDLPTFRTGILVIPPSPLARSIFPISTYLPLGFTILWSAIRD